MANNRQRHHSELNQAPAADDFLEHLLGIPSYATTTTTSSDHNQMMLQLSSSSGTDGKAGFHGSGFPMGLSLDQVNTCPGGGGFLKLDDEASAIMKRAGEDPNLNNTFEAQPLQKQNSTPCAPQRPAMMRPRVRARRGQAIDPHSIAERLRRERIAERIRALQELVPRVNKTDRAAILDEIVDYVKFLRLQVKVLSMSRIGGPVAVAPLVMDIPLSSVEEGPGEEGRNQPAREKWSNDGTEQHLAKLIEDNIGAAMQFLQSK